MHCPACLAFCRLFVRDHVVCDPIAFYLDALDGYYTVGGVEMHRRTMNVNVEMGLHEFCAFVRSIARKLYGYNLQLHKVSSTWFWLTLCLLNSKYPFFSYCALSFLWFHFKCFKLCEVRIFFTAGLVNCIYACKSNSSRTPNTSILYECLREFKKLKMEIV